VFDRGLDLAGVAKFCAEIFFAVAKAKSRTLSAASCSD
jgi:hypothetical protein